MDDYDDCVDTTCPVHFRNDHQGEGEFGHPYFITYVGNYAVFSDVDVKAENPEEASRVAMEAIIALLSGDRERSDRLIESVTESFTYVYRVGQGAILDSPNTVDKFHGKPGDVKDLHEMAVEMYKMNQNV